MAKVSIPPDCGNAPKKNLLKDLAVAAVNGDLKFVESLLSDDLTWEIVGQSSIAGKENVLKGLPQHKLWKAKELVVDTIITHGREASVNGQIVARDNSSYSFCEVFRFKSAGSTAIQSIKTFMIKHN